MSLVKSYFFSSKKQKNVENAFESGVPMTGRKRASPSTAISGATTPSEPTCMAMSEALRYEVKVEFLYQQQLQKLWTASGEDEGVLLKMGRSEYACRPAELAYEPGGLFSAIAALNVKCAMTVFTRITKSIALRIDRPYVPLGSGLRLQVLPDISWLPQCQKHQFAALIQDKGMLVVWDDEPKHLPARAAEILDSLMEVAWADEAVDPNTYDEKKNATASNHEVSDEEDSDVERCDPDKPRPIVLIQSVLTAFTLALSISVLGAGWRNIVVELILDQKYLRLAFLLVVPLQFWVALFFFQCLVTNIAQLIGPIAQIRQNSKYFSGTAPKRLNSENGPLPHVTIQCPVYKEGLEAVIKPTMFSIKAAISSYEMQGGTANIFVNDDGMQLISEDESRARQDFYDEHNIGWVARPRHDPKGQHGEPFTRQGKFKKASNMNYALWVSNRVEDKLNDIVRAMGWTQKDEAKAYTDAFMEVVEEDQGITWADGNIRMGDYILIVDSDTRVPTDCLLDAVSEMEHSPEVAIIQFSSGVMNVTDSFFERGITFFTNLIYTQIRYGVSNGDVAPFVGHNAILRWAAIQSIAYECKADGHEKYWSESTVSEDFDMALRLQNSGYVVRMAAYQGDGFKEGVSLTVYDELARWEKYAYGCSELIFHPFRYWFTRGPFTKLFRDFMRSGMPLQSKFTIMAYIGTYYALGSAWPLTVMNYLLLGWFNGALDHYYLDSFKIFLACILIFNALGNVSLAVLRYRIAEKPLVSGVLENVAWIPLLSVFLGGVSLHVSQALLCHLLCIDLAWGATNKEAEATTFFREMHKVMRNFKYTFLWCLFTTVVMVVMATVVPWSWRIELFVAIFPMALVTANHFLLPIILNPGLMLFTW